MERRILVSRKFYEGPASLLIGLSLVAPGCTGMFPFGESGSKAPASSKPAVEWRTNETRRDTREKLIPTGLDERSKDIERNLGVR